MSSLLARNTFYLTTTAIGQKVIAFVYFLFLARVMQPESTGIYFLAVSFIMIFSVVADFGITHVVVREIAKTPERAKELLRGALGAKLLFMVLAVFVANIASVGLGYDTLVIQLILLASVSLFCDAVHLLFYGALRGMQKLQYEALGMFAGHLASVTVGALVLCFYPSLHLLIIALMFASVVNVMVSVSKVVNILGIGVLVPTFEKRNLGLLLKAALPFALAAVFVKVYSYVDSILISKYLGTAELGYYAVAYKFTYAFQFLPMAFIAALYPGISASIDKDEFRVNQMMEKGMWYMAILVIPISLGIWAIAPEAVLLAGDNYAPAAPVLQILIFALIPLFLDFPIGSLLNAANRQSTKTAIMGITMVINVVLNLFLIPRIGIIGAAIAALISFIFLFCTGYYFINKIIPSFTHTQFLKIVGPIVLSGILMLAATLLIKPVVGWIAVIPIAAVVYMTALWIFGAVKRSDLNLIKKLISR